MVIFKRGLAILILQMKLRNKEDKWFAYIPLEAHRNKNCDNKILWPWHGIALSQLFPCSVLKIACMRSFVDLILQLYSSITVNSSVYFFVLCCTFQSSPWKMASVTVRSIPYCRFQCIVQCTYWTDSSVNDQNAFVAASCELIQRNAVFMS